ncbi:uncharacterized protein LOC110434703 isoform X2 [Sorghum bicolor]|uniref:uncharacterized protein LOC110434703 isoform X2 n=1 Tax=Sorghum bicolor TaxID=4558 RepID=UPI000B426622|nr:uncharacterized protein LOC110434703 isoform X2 [Sorghum bicolor]|eukprot:XP_021315063.1 uncharacterized protein LOC110434703 isoform X2 [Sorghum bicolor]
MTGPWRCKSLSARSGAKLCKHKAMVMLIWEKRWLPPMTKLELHWPEGVCMYMAWFDIGSYPSWCAAPLQTTFFLHEKDDDHPRPMAVESKRVVLGRKGKATRDGNGHLQWGLPAASRPMDPP